MNLLVYLEKMRLLIPDVKWIRKVLTELRIVTYRSGYFPERITQKAADNPDARKTIVCKWEKRHRRMAGKLAAMVNEIANSNPRIRTETDCEDYLISLKYCYYAYGFLPYEFINYDLYHKTEKEIYEFVSNLETAALTYRMNDILAMSLFRDKCLTYNAFKQYYHRECLCIERKSDYESFRLFVKRHPVFVKKQVNGSKGQAVKRVDINCCSETVREIFDQMINEGKYIVEELIVQSHEMSVFNSSSVNTVRCTTILTKEGPKIAFCFLAAGRDGSFVNNGGAGGILIGIDAETGKLNTAGVDENGLRYNEHPDSGVPFIGHQLPEWKELLRICKEAAIIAGEKDCHYVGWDMSHTERYGWVIIEGNGSGQLIGPQTTSQNGMRARIESLMNQMT